MTQAAEIPRHDPALSQWFTPAALADRIAEEWGPWAGLRVLEPAAGDGALVAPLAARGALVEAFEIDERWAARIAGRVEAYGAGGQDLAFVAKALRHALEVIAVVRLAFLAGRARRAELWSQAHLADLRVLSRRPRFSGTSSTARYDFAVVRIVRDLHPAALRLPWGACRVDWWGVEEAS